MTDDMQAELERLRELDRKRTPGEWTTWPQSPTFVRSKSPNGWGVFTEYHITHDQAVNNANFAASAPAMMPLLERMWARIGELERERAWRPMEDDAMDGEAFIGGHFRDGLNEQRVVYFDADPARPDHIWKLVDGDVTFHKDFFTHCKPLSKPPEQKP